MIAYPAEIDGVRTRIIECGSGPAILLLHGLGTRADRWLSNIEGLAAAGRRVIAFDLPGHGFADKGTQFDYSVPGYSRFVFSLIEAFQLKRLALVGASFGGQVAGAVAATISERVEALVLVGSTGLAEFGSAARRQTAKVLVDMSRDGIRTRLLRGLRNHELITESLVEEDFQINNSPGAAEAFRALGDYFANRIDDDIILGALANSSPPIPTLLVWGTEDLSVPITIAEQAAIKLPGSHLARIEDAAHNPYMDQPQQFNQIVLDLLRMAEASTSKV